MPDTHVALVTGGGSGIGAAVCHALAGAGAFVAVAGRRIDRCEVVAKLIREGGGAARAVRLDVQDPASVAAAVREIAEAAGPVDWLVANAGIAISAPIGAEGPEGAEDLYARHLEVNFHGARRALEAVLPGMLAAGYGRAVFVASSAALQGYPYVAAYAASKHALLGYARSAALELARKGVAVSAVCPHYVDSPMTDASVERIVAKTGQSESEARSFLASQNPSGELVTTDEVASAVRDLVLGDTAGVTLELIGKGERREVDLGFPVGRRTT